MIDDEEKGAPELCELCGQPLEPNVDPNSGDYFTVENGEPRQVDGFEKAHRGCAAIWERAVAESTKNGMQ